MSKTAKGLGFREYFVLGFLVFSIFAAIINCNRESNETKSESSLDCNTIQSWTSDQDIINSLQGTWIMEYEDYYGKRKFQFSGNGGRCWKMESGSGTWIDEGSISFEESTRYDNNTKRNIGTEYVLSYKAPIGWFTFNVDCLSGLSVESGRYTYGISLLKIE